MPFHILPLPIFEYTLGSWLATDAFDYMEQLVREADVSGQLLENEESVLFALLAPQLSDSARKEHWDILVAANRLERGRIKDIATSPEKDASESALFVGLEEKLGRQKRTSLRWQWTTFAIALVLLGYVFMRQYFKQQSQNEIRAAIKKAQHSKQNIIASKINITKEDIRKIHMGLTKGHQIAEALLSLQKVEILQNNMSTSPPKESLDTIKGIKDLNESEHIILKLSLEGLSSKEISHQLRVSTGYVYNSRSAIRKKLGIPKEKSIRNWIEQQTT
jgi:DNA-binding CsgD family transcriptional regulator